MGVKPFSFSKLLQTPWYWLNQNFQVLELVSGQESFRLFLATSKILFSPSLTGFLKSVISRPVG
jgi:hypothetical protein